MDILDEIPVIFKAQDTFIDLFQQRDHRYLHVLLNDEKGKTRASIAFKYADELERFGVALIGMAAGFKRYEGTLDDMVSSKAHTLETYGNAKLTVLKSAAQDGVLVTSPDMRNFSIRSKSVDDEAVGLAIRAWFWENDPETIRGHKASNRAIHPV